MIRGMSLQTAIKIAQKAVGELAFAGYNQRDICKVVHASNTTLTEHFLDAMAEGRRRRVMQARPGGRKP
jgi:hypothetical protein